jgi:hypothetical protein
LENRSTIIGAAVIRCAIANGGALEQCAKRTGAVASALENMEQVKLRRMRRFERDRNSENESGNQNGFASNPENADHCSPL